MVIIIRLLSEVVVVMVGMMIMEAEVAVIRGIGDEMILCCNSIIRGELVVGEARNVIQGTLCLLHLSALLNPSYMKARAELVLFLKLRFTLGLSLLVLSHITNQTNTLV